MSWKVGLGHSEDDLEIQGEIDFEFFDDDDDVTTNKTDKQNGATQNGSIENGGACSSSSNRILNGGPTMTTTTKVIETVIPNLEEADENSSSSVSVSDSDGMTSSLSEEDSNYDGLSDSESITDVTPITCNSPYFIDSPRPQSRLKKSYNRDADFAYYESNGSNKKKDSVLFTEPSVQDGATANSSVDLNMLVAAIKRLEVQQNHTSATNKHKSIAAQSKTRKNMSFSNDEVRRIDQENQRLLKRIVTQNNRHKSTAKGGFGHVPSSQVYRHRKQRQIEVENVALLRRIESAKPSRELSRAHLLRDFNRMAGSPAGLSCSARSSSASSRPSSSVASFPVSSITRQSVRSYSLGCLPKLCKNAPSPPSSLTIEDNPTSRLQQQRNST